MPLITKASLRGKKPAWQRGLKPPTKANADLLAITANNEQKFTRAFGKLLSSLMTPEMLKIVDRAIRAETTVESILNAIPFFDPDDPETFAIWESFAVKTERTYMTVINETIENENRKRGWKTPTLKIEKPEMPVSPSAEQFVRVQSLTRVVDMSKKEKERVREILTAGLESGARASSMVAEIAATVGLTKFQIKALRKKLVAFKAATKKRLAAARAQLRAGTITKEKFEEIEEEAEISVDKFQERHANAARRNRARTIARTETNDAQSQGLTESWKRAADEGLTPPGTKKKWVAMGDEVTSDICTDLNTHEPVLIGETFSTDVDGGWTGQGPPAHPNCRSTLVLVFPE